MQIKQFDGSEHVKFGEEVIAEIADIFPENAEFDYKINDWHDLRISVCWELSDDKERPHKPSKIIFLKFIDEALVQYFLSNKKDRQKINDKIKEQVSIKMKTFDSSHDNSISQSPPCEEWVIDL